jgi:hypothetical protein
MNPTELVVPTLNNEILHAVLLKKIRLQDIFEATMYGWVLKLRCMAGVTEKHISLT